MTLSARDKNIVIAIGAVVLLVVIFLALVKPFWLDNRSSMLNKIQRDTFNYNSDKDVLDNQPKVRMAWDVLVSDGMKDNPTDEIWAAETLVYQLAGRSGVNVDSQRTTRASPYKEGKTDTDFTEYQFNTTATGNSFGVGQFLVALEDSKFPLKIEDLVIRARKPGTNDLQIQLNIAVLVYTPKVTTRPASTRAGRSSSTHPSTMAATAPSSGLSIDEIENQLKLRREKELNAPASTQPATTMPLNGAAAPTGFTPGAPGFTSGAGFTPGAGMTPATATTTTAPSGSAADLEARLKARREQQDQMTGAVPAATQPTTQPTGGVR